MADINIQLSDLNTAAFIVYRATNTLNGKFYIGVTRIGLAKRAQTHIYESQSKHHGCKKFHSAIRKYGKDNFFWEVVDTANSFDELMSKEAEWVLKLKPEYNICRGGWGAPGARTGKTHTKEVKEKLRQLGLERIDTFKQYQHLGPASMRKKVICVTTGKIYESVSEASRDTGADRASISEICIKYKNGRKQVGGLVFSYSIGDSLVHG